VKTHDVSLNIGKTKILPVGRAAELHRDARCLRIKRRGGGTVEAVKVAKLLGLKFDTALNFGEHCETVLASLKLRAAAMRALCGSTWGISVRSALAVQNGLIESKARYGLSV